MQELKTGLVHLLSSAAVSAEKQSRPKTNKQSYSTIFRFPPLKHKLIKLSSFLAVQDSSIGDLVTHSLTHSLTHSVSESLLISATLVDTSRH